ncbi:YqaA family protein [Glaciecola siphonariae]|uniref:YqaA family protein n=1 Tax=Glaciecola siphonariae TaxID=521012 RepID=A0ABV9LR87_9ALTE
MGTRKRLKKRIKKMIHSEHMLPSIGLASFLESTVVPIPLETLLIPLMQARREKLWLIAAVTTLGCLVGALLGYFIGYFLFDLLRDPIMTYITTEQEFETFKGQMDTHGFWFVFSTGVTPIPLQIAMLIAGVTSYSLFLYMLAITTSRCIRYFGLAILVYFFGNRTEKIVRRYKWQVVVGISILIAGFITYKILSA